MDRGLPSWLFVVGSHILRSFRGWSEQAALESEMVSGFNQVLETGN